MKSISVFLNKEGNTASPKEEGIIKVYSYDETDKTWYITEEFDFTLLNSTSIINMRSTIFQMIERVGDCKVFVAKEAVGQLFSVLEANGFSIYEAEGKPEEFLESILASEMKENEQSQNNKEQSAMPYPKETSVAGTYFIDLKAALSLSPDITSKKVLLPFLSTKNFKILEVVCDHVPKWFDDEFKRQGFHSEILKLKENSYKVVISL